jgi:hypothetical protein
LRIADCGLSGRISSGEGIRNPQSEIRNGDRDLTPRHRYQDNVSPLPENQVAHETPAAPQKLLRDLAELL